MNIYSYLHCLVYNTYFEYVSKYVIKNVIQLFMWALIELRLLDPHYLTHALGINGAYLHTGDQKGISLLYVG